MKFVPASVLLVFLFTSSYFSQPKPLPDVLKPDPASEAEAQRMGAEVFKLVKRGTFEASIFNAPKDEENPIGIRGGGSYYSFTTRSHSYNKIPQIGLLEDGRLRVGFAGLDYGFFTNLGQRELSDLGSTSPEVRFFLSYRPPSYQKEIIQAGESFARSRVDHLTLEKTIESPLSGNVYLLRAISIGQADVAVVFRIMAIEKDSGSMTIAWKKLADFEKPLQLYETDEDLQGKVNAVIADLNITEMNVVVENNELRIRGTYVNKNLDRFRAALVSRNIKYRGMIIELRHFPN